MILKPSWPQEIIPKNIQAAYTTRQGGVSEGPYTSFNLGTHVGDDPQKVAANRLALTQDLGLKTAPVWLNQVHGNDILNLDNYNPDNYNPDTNLSYDASFTTQPNKVCVVMSADCLPVLLCDLQGHAVAALHCGWRSIAAGLIEKAIELFTSNNIAPENIIAWLGPAIGPSAFQVDNSMRSQFTASNAFIPLSNESNKSSESSLSNYYLANIQGLASERLLKKGVLAHHIYANAACTYNQSRDFYSYRRDKITGRMATLIWKI